MVLFERITFKGLACLALLFIGGVTATTLLASKVQAVSINEADNIAKSVQVDKSGAYAQSRDYSTSQLLVVYADTDTQTSKERTDRGIVEEPPVADPAGENKQKIEEYMRTHGQNRIDQPVGSENMATPADNSPAANDAYIIEEDRIEPIADNSQAQLNLVLIIAAVMLGSIVLAAGIVTIVKRKK